MPRKNWSTSFINCNKSVRTHLGRTHTIGTRHWMVWLYIKMGNKIFDLYWWSFITYMCRLQLVKLQPLEWLHLVMSRKYLKRLVFVHNFTTCLFFFFMSSFIPSLPCTGFPCIRFHVQSNDKGCNSKFRLWLYTETGILVFFYTLVPCFKVILECKS